MDTILCHCLDSVPSVCYPGFRYGRDDLTFFAASAGGFPKDFRILRRPNACSGDPLSSHRAFRRYIASMFLKCNTHKKDVKEHRSLRHRASEALDDRPGRVLYLGEISDS